MKLYLQDFLFGEQFTFLSAFDTNEEFYSYLDDFCKKHNSPYVCCWMNGTDTVMYYGSHTQYLVLKQENSNE